MPTPTKRKGVTCPVCKAEVITAPTRRNINRRLRHREDGTHTMERVW